MTRRAATGAVSASTPAHPAASPSGRGVSLTRRAFDLSGIVGLSEQTAAGRLAAEGYNELPSRRRRHVLRIALDVVLEPMFLLLVACGAIYLALGDIREAIMLLGFVGVVMTITIYQQRRTERALEALRDLSSPRALVIRDGVRHRIAGREVVREDIIVLSEGDRVPADAVVLSENNLTADESLLTGESVPVRKASWDEEAVLGRPGGDDLPFVYSGSMIVQGQGVARVLATGLRTELGRIGKALQTVAPEENRLQRETRRLVRNVAVFGLALCVLVAIVYAVSRHNLLGGLLAGITLAMAVLPEEFPVVLAIFLALGAWRMAQQRVLTRDSMAIESLGAATVLCVDKTGTLTQNRMSVQRLGVGDRTYDTDVHACELLPEYFHEIIEFAVLASKRDPFDPMEQAINVLGRRSLARTEHLHRDWHLQQEYPLSRDLLALSRVWRSPDGADYVIAAKGAPEAIADLCHFTADQTDVLTRQVAAFAADGLRVLGVAKAAFRHESLPVVQHDFHFRFLGIVGLADPVRESVAPAIEECYDAGVRVIMITGDYSGTAQNIGRQIGLRAADQVITGAELDQVDDTALRARIHATSIFARAVPEQKLRLVQALKADGEVVAMTGDGVNDAPALRAAHIGLAMGGRGTDVARESAALVILDDDFSSIVRAIRMGRRIYDNLKKAMAYIFAIHVPIAGMSLLPVLFGWPLVLLPVHIVFLELIIDPACSVVFEAEPEERDVMKRPPRGPQESVFGRRSLVLSLLQGSMVLLIVVAVFIIALARGLGADEARALTFTTLIFANLGLILTNRSWSRTILGTLATRNRAMWWVIGGAAAFLALALAVPFLRSLFHFAPLSLVDVAICLSAGGVSILWFEVLKFIRTARCRRPAPVA